jgi:acyl-CoA thioesterase I
MTTNYYHTPGWAPPSRWRPSSLERFVTVTVILLLVSAGISGCGNDSPTSPPRAQIVYVAMGASDAVGIGAFPLENGYVYRIKDGLEPRANEVILYNLGVSGKQSHYLEDTELPTAITRQPDVITIWTGPNDLIYGNTVEKFENSLKNILQQLRQQTVAVIVLANIPDLTQLPRFLLVPDSDVTAARVAAFNAVIAQQAAAYNVPLVDLFAGGYAADWEYVSLDGFHPSNQGHAKLAQLYLDIILNYF